LRQFFAIVSQGSRCKILFKWTIAKTFENERVAAALKFPPPFSILFATRVCCRWKWACDT